MQQKDSTRSFSLASLQLIRVAACSPELRVANPEFNTEKILECYINARSNGAQLLAFPELCISAYTCADLFYETTLLDECEASIRRLCRANEEHEGVLIVGAPLRSMGQLYNCAVVIAHGKILGVVPKSFLPGYNEFYEPRWFASSLDASENEIAVAGELCPFGTDLIFSHRSSPLSAASSFSFGVEICEDLWATKSPSTDLALAGAQMVINLSASNELVTKADYRRDLVRMQSARCIAAYVYASAGAYESSTDLVFAGHNLICENGSVIAEGERFSFGTQWCVADVDIERLENGRIRNSTFRAERATGKYRAQMFFLDDVHVEVIQRTINAHPFIPAEHHDRISVCKEIMDIQSTALARRLLQTGMQNVVIGLSGGLDSTLALLVCIQCFEKLKINTNGIHAVALPGLATSKRTHSNAHMLAETLGVSYQSIDISQSVLQHFADIGHDENVFDSVYENAQARERTQVLMDLANKYNSLVIGTGDLSELALGWCTYNGDHMSMYSVNCGVPKTLVRSIVGWYADDVASAAASVILRDVCSTPVSPELIPSHAGAEIQDTEKSIGPYELHDFFLYYFMRHHFGPKKILSLCALAFHDKYARAEILKWLQVFYHRFFTQQFKRSAMPDGPKVGSVALSPRGDWRMPSDADVSLWRRELGQAELE